MVEGVLALEEAGEASGPLADWGTGSGVLAISAAKLGWGPVRGCDREPASLEAAAENARTNGVELELTKVDVREVAHLEQLGIWSDPTRHPDRWELATAYLGLVPLGLDPRLPPDTRWHPVESLPPTAFDHEAIVLAGRERLRGKLSYSNIGFALAPEGFTLAELRDVYEAALGYEVSATNLKRVLLRRGAIEPVGQTKAHGPAGGRPAQVYRYSSRRLEVTDPFAVLRPRADGGRRARPQAS